MVKTGFRLRVVVDVDKIQEALKKRKRTIKNICKIAQISPSTFYKISKGKRPVITSLDNLLNIAKALGYENEEDIIENYL